MAAGTDITHPVSALDGVYKPVPLENFPLCTIVENGSPLDCDDSPIMQQDREAARPPRPASVGDRANGHRRSASAALLSGVSRSTDLIGNTPDELPTNDGAGISVGYMPVIRSGVWMDIGLRPRMEDMHVRIDDLMNYAGSVVFSGDEPGAYYGVFDGHNGDEAASFASRHLLTKILEDVEFPTSKVQALKNGFLQTDLAFEVEDSQAGTTALTAMVFGRTLLVANAGDCRAVLSRRGVAVNMSRDHKPGCLMERSRIEAAGGYVFDEYLNGQLGVARALGDWRFGDLKRSDSTGPLSAEPDVEQRTLTEEDEFLIIGCDGLWDVFTSQNAVDFARKKLQEHNDPERCSKELVNEALLRQTSDNVTVVMVCFSPIPPPPKVQAYVPRFKRSVSAEGLKSLQDLLDGGDGPAGHVGPDVRPDRGCP